MSIFKTALNRKNTDTEIDAAVLAERQQKVDARLRKVTGDLGKVDYTAGRGSTRKHKRAAAYRIASTQFMNGLETSCRVTDQSYSGFRLLMNDDVDCPEEFALTIPTLRFIGIVRKSWQKGRVAGVSILRWNDCV